jgi:hypothetical protein
MELIGKSGFTVSGNGHKRVILVSRIFATGRLW